ncbi:MAG: GWxTD domain-containing protein [Flavobacteriales bacterium]
MSRVLRTLVFMAALVLLLAGCSTYVPVAGGDNFAYLYGKGAAAVRLSARVHHSSDDRSTIYFKLNTGDLLYRNAGGGGPFRANVLLKYEAYPLFGSTQLLDSASTFVKDTSTDPTEEKDLIGSMEMKRNDQRSFVLKVTARDLNREAESTVFIPVERDIAGERQNFLPTSTKGVPLFTDQVPPGMDVRIRCERYAGRTLQVQHFVAPAKLPPPVFVTADQGMPQVQLDSTFTITVEESGTFGLRAPEQGFYHIRVDTASREGFTLFSLAECYPFVDRSEDLVPPLRYLTSLQEWDRITGAQDKRVEVERFWTDATGSRDRAREAIATFYGRVENANRHFTSWVEGWRSDRGLVSIIFGAPNNIRKTATSEVWTYGEESNMTSLTFIFEKRPGAFSDNDLVLRRDPLFKSAWYRNVESWRNGRILQN